jgi:hypothetical protein
MGEGFKNFYKRNMKSFLTCLLFGLQFLVYSQDSSLVIRNLSVPNNEKVLYDKFQNIYVTTSDPALVQFDEKGIKKSQFNEFKYGKFTLVDLNNPLSILIYYGDFGIVQILDRNLTLQSEINLRSLGYQTNTAIGLGADNNIWFYNLEKLRLIKIDPTGKIIRKSNELIGLIGKSIIKGQIWEQDNFLLARAPGFGWMLFDDFGGYIQTLPLPDDEIQYFSNDKISYRTDDQINILDLNSMRVKSYPIPGLVDPAKDVQFINGCWIERSTDSIKIYSLK